MIKEDKPREPKPKRFEEPRTVVRTDNTREVPTGLINLIKFNKNLFRHFLAVLDGKTPAPPIGKLDSGKTFEFANRETCQKLVSAVPDKLRREALVGLMGHSGCSFCVEVIKMYPREYKAIFPHFMIHKPFGDNLILPFSYKPKRYNCPMLIHLPLEARRKMPRTAKTTLLDVSGSKKGMYL